MLAGEAGSPAALGAVGQGQAQQLGRALGGEAIGQKLLGSVRRPILPAFFPLPGGTGG